MTVTVNDQARPVPRSPLSSVRGTGRADLRIMQRATLLIDDLGADLDRLLMDESAESERLRLLRATTVRITRAANDAIQAYQRGRRAVDADLNRSKANRDATLAMRAGLQAARVDLLRSLEAAGRRYPPGDDAEPPVRHTRLTGRERA